MAKRLTIGELSRRTGVPVKTLRYYSDEGLLPPAERSRSGYRLYAEEHVVRIDLIRTLREAGIGLEAIGRVLRRDIKLEEALRLRLGAIEAHVASLQRVASALRAAIRSGATEPDLRRLSMVTRLSNDERKKVIETFYEKVAEGYPAFRDWIRAMVEASSPALPEDATSAQLDAWVELATMLEDPTFIASTRRAAADFWTETVDLAAYQAANGTAVKAAREARSGGLTPKSPEARAIVERLANEMAAAASGELGDAKTAYRNILERHDPRMDRYWELIAAMKGEPAPDNYFHDWRWLGDAIRYHFSAA